MSPETKHYCVLQEAVESFTILCFHNRRTRLKCGWEGDDRSLYTRGVSQIEKPALNEDLARKIEKESKEPTKLFFSQGKGSYDLR